MAKYSSSPEFDQNDPKMFRESLGSFGTTTVPGGNQLVELQTKVRQGVKHVELHLMGRGKGQFNQQDVPDKYGFEQRRTIMQLAKLNQQTLSVHGTFDVNSFAGISRNGFSEAERLNSMKEIDETLKFAAETAKGGAVVFHLHETNLTMPPGEVNLPKKYLEKLEKEKPEEYKRIMEEYLHDKPLRRLFVDNPHLESEVKLEFNNLPAEEKSKYKTWEDYFSKKKMEQIKYAPEVNPLIVIGDAISKVERSQPFLDFKALDKLSSKDKEALKSLGVKIGDKSTINDFQKLNAIFTPHTLSSDYSDKISADDFYRIRDKIYVEYENLLKENHNMQSQADKEFYQRQMEANVELMKRQREELRTKHEMYKDELEKIRELEDESRDLVRKLEGFRPKEGDLKEQAALEVARATLSKKNEEREYLIRMMGYTEYQELHRYDENIAQINKQITELEEKKGVVKALTDEVFDKNTVSMGELGIKALRYQLDLLDKSKTSASKAKEMDKRISELETRYANAKTEEERNRIHNELVKAKYDRRLVTGLKDYEDIDLVERPLYLAPENIMAGYGYMDSLEEYKAVIRESWEKFAEKLMSPDPFYKKLREDYEKAMTQKTGKIVKIDSLEKAKELAKRHIAGTFDNAHAGVWLKYFRRKEDESDEDRLKRFNEWLNSEAESMAREGIVKHFHFNDTQGKDDDHNLLGSGVLDIHDLRERLRKAGVKEPLIVEAGGRGGAQNMHLMNAFDIFNPSLRMGPGDERGYNANFGGSFQGTSISDWVSVKRAYENRPQYSAYGMSYNTFKHQAPQGGNQRGGWSGTSFL